MKNGLLDRTAAPRRVDYFSYAEDLQCVLLANIGLMDDAIASITGLTIGQVRYRLAKAWAGRRKGQATARMQYRRGDSPAVQAVIRTVTGRNSEVKRLVTENLDKKGLYQPLPSGVMTNNRKV